MYTMVKRKMTKGQANGGFLSTLVTNPMINHE
jgi:hypothetical protein